MATEIIKHHTSRLVTNLTEHPLRLAPPIAGAVISELGFNFARWRPETDLKNLASVNPLDPMSEQLKITDQTVRLNRQLAEASLPSFPHHELVGWGLMTAFMLKQMVHRDIDKESPGKRLILDAYALAGGLAIKQLPELALKTFIDFPNMTVFEGLLLVVGVVALSDTLYQFANDTAHTIMRIRRVNKMAKEGRKPASKTKLVERNVDPEHEIEIDEEIKRRRMNWKANQNVERTLHTYSQDRRVENTKRQRMIDKDNGYLPGR
jgi:hypothetical protein